MATEWAQRDRQHGLDLGGRSLLACAGALRWAVYLGLTLLIAAFMGQRNTFIYFQF